MMTLDEAIEWSFKIESRDEVKDQDLLDIIQSLKTNTCVLERIDKMALGTVMTSITSSDPILTISIMLFTSMAIGVLIGQKVNSEDLKCQEKP